MASYAASRVNDSSVRDRFRVFSSSVERGQLEDQRCRRT